MDTKTFTSPSQAEKNSKEQKLTRFSCKICLEVAEQPVITPCGHLYCWQCIYQWAKVKNSCPFCNSVIDVNKLTTIYTEEDDSSKGTSKNQELPNQQDNAGSNNSQQNSEPQQEQQQQQQQQQQGQEQQQSQQQQQEEIPRRPQNPYQNNDRQQQQNNNGGFNLNFFGFPGLFVGGFNLGGFGLNLGGFQFGGQNNNNNQRGIARYLGFIPLLFFLAQFILPIINSFIGRNSQSEYQDHYETRNKRQYKNKYEDYSYRNKKSYSRQQDRFEDYDEDYSFISLFEAICAFLLMGLIIFLNKRRRQ